MYRIDIGIDMGSSNIRIYMRDKGVVLNQPSVIAYEKKTGRIIGVGTKAKRMIGKVTEGISAVCPIERSSISDFSLTERMIRAFLQNARRKRRIFGRPNICIAMPVEISEVKRRAAINAIVRTGAGTVYVIDRPMATAIGAGIDIYATKGHLILDIGGGTTEMTVIASGGVAASKMIPIGGNDFTEALIRYVRKTYNIELGEVSAEESKIDSGSIAITDPADMCEIRGKNLLNGIPVKMDISVNETVPVYEETGRRILSELTSFIDKLDPEIISDVTEGGIFLAGGGSCLSGMERFIGDNMKMKIIREDNPDEYAAYGAGLASDYIAATETLTK